ncbi:hypothetical protein RCO48_25235 [Peribacillus frigoritolerans]|nr:hypothetical protein [Peribacillus frigoritolerans]
MIYFDFVERKNPEIMFGIMKHNEWEYLSLITLYIHLSRKNPPNRWIYGRIHGDCTMARLFGKKRGVS